MEAVAISGSGSLNAVADENTGESQSPETAAGTSSRLNKWATRLVMAVGTVLAVGVLALTVGPRFLPYQAYTVLSGSMEPTLPVGSVIIAVPVQADELRTGDVVTIVNPQQHGMLVTHRIVSIHDGSQGRTFTTKGDANGAPDSWVVTATGSGWRYAFSIPYVGYVLSVLQSELGRLLLLVIPTLLLGGVLLVEIWRPAKVSDKALHEPVPAGA